MSILILDRDILEISKVMGSNLSEVTRDLLRSYFLGHEHDIEHEKQEIEKQKKLLEAREKSLNVKEQKMAAENMDKIMDDYRRSWLTTHPTYVTKYEAGVITTKGWIFLARELKFKSRQKTEEYMLNWISERKAPALPEGGRGGVAGDAPSDIR